jgi:hypothetical protein
MKIKNIIFLTLSIVGLQSYAFDSELDYEASIVANTSSGDFAPYMIGSWQGGKFTQKNSITADISLSKPLDTQQKFSWSAGVEVLAHDAASAYYDSYNETDGWFTQSIKPNALRLQQLWGEAKYRCLHFLVGMKEHKALIVDDKLSSGEFVISNNARPIPGVSLGFIDFQDIPYTNGWVQVDLELKYGKFADSGFNKLQYNHYSYLIPQNILYTYKYCHFRTNPNKPLSVTVGMQAAGQFGGYTDYYSYGKLRRSSLHKFHISDIWDMLFPTLGNGEGYYKGNTLGSWDLKARYKLKNGNEAIFYFEGPWEDGSGIGRQNGFDGIYGLEFKWARRGLVNAVVAEYLDFTNQSGPIHWAPNDYENTTITDHATGGDNYYNNDVYGSYAHYGMSIGTPFLLSPLYNTDGYTGYKHNRSRGFHLGVSGNITNEVEYRIMCEGQWAWGTGRIANAKRYSDGSVLVEANWHADRVLQGLSFKVQAAKDAGSLRGNNIGALFSVKYTGQLPITK